MRDIRFAFRSLWRTPGYAVTALVILSLSVGAATAVFSMLYALVLRPLPVPNPHELVQVSVFNHRDQLGDMTWRQYRELAARQTVFKALITSLQQSVATVETERATQILSVTGVSANYFAEFGARPVLGRFIEPSDINEAAATAEPVVVASWDFWQRQFGGDPSIVGRSIKVDGTPMTIVGVAPKGFLGISISIDPDITVPVTAMPALLRSEASMVAGTSSWVATTGRLKDGVTLAQARAQIESMWPEILRDAAPQTFRTSQRDEYFKRRVSVESGANGWERGLRSRYANPLTVLLAIAVLVLAIASINLCSLVFARIQARRHEIGVRLAIGSGRWRIVREWLAEGAILGFAGSTAGLLLATAASRSLIEFLLRDYAVRTSLDVSPDLTIVSIALAVGIAVAAFVTGWSAWLITRDGTLGLSPGGTRTVARSWNAGRLLVGAQVALSIVLLSQASLLVRNVYGMTSLDSGLTSDTVLVTYPTERVGAYRNLDPIAYYRNVLDRVRALPGVAAASFVSNRPQGGAIPAEFAGRAGTGTDADTSVEWALLSPGFFDTMGIAVLRGRDFTLADAGRSRKVAIISQTTERLLFGEGKGLGERLRVTRRPELQDAEVIGIVRDARVFDVRRANQAIVYTAALQSDEAHYKFLAVRAPETTLAAVGAAVDSFGAEYIRKTVTLEYARSRTILQERVMAGIGGFFGVLALVLVSVGLYGLLSYVLSQRRKEFGIRLALGASPALIGRQITANAALITAAGAVIGLGLAIFTAPLLRSVLVNTSPYDPLAIGAACIVLFVVTLGASLAPAARAARVEPLEELRQH